MTARSGMVSRSLRMKSTRKVWSSTATNCSGFSSEPAFIWKVGTPITAKDVKWSFDRAVTVGGFPTFQMKAGSLEKPEQFVAVDDNTFRVLGSDRRAVVELGVLAQLEGDGGVGGVP